MAVPPIEIKVTSDTTGADKAAASLNRVSGAAQQTQKKSVMASGGMRMLTQQLSQVAQQATATGRPMQALAVQAADIGLAFGVVGTAVGALVGVAMPALIAAFSKAGDEGKEFAEVLDKITSAQQSLEKRLFVRQQGIADEEMATVLFEKQLLIQERAALVDKARNAEGRERSRINKEIEAVSGNILQLSTKESRIQKILSDLRAEDARAISAMHQAYVPLTAKQRELADNARSAQTSFEEMVKKTTKLKQDIGEGAYEALRLAGVDMAGPISAAAIEAAKLASNLGIALGAAQALQGGVDPTSGKRYGGRGSVVPTKTDSILAGMGGVFVSSSGAGGAAGGGGAVSELASSIEALRETLATENELLTERYATQQEMLQDALEQRMLTQQEYQDLSLRSAREYQEALAELERSKQSARLTAISGAFGDLASLMNTENRKLFKIGQAAAIAEATVSGYKAAVEAWEKGMKIGGPPVAAAFSAASLAKTGALISGIASQSIGGGSAAGTASAGAAAAAAPAPMQVSVSGLDDDALFSGKFVSGLLDKLQDEAGDRGIAFV